MSEKPDTIEQPAGCCGSGEGPGCCCGVGGWGGPRGAELVLRWVIILAALMLYLWPVTGDLYGDEGHTLRTVSEGDLMENLNRPDSCHPPLFFAAAKLCRAAVGRDWAIRLPSVLAALGALVIVWPLTRRLLGERYVAPALLIMGFSPLLVEFASEARPYAMLVLFSTLLIWLMARFLDRESWLGAILLAATAAAGLATHFIFAAQLVFAALWYLCARRKLTWKSAAALALFAPVGYLLVTGAADDAGFSKSFTELWRQEFSLANYLGKLPFAMAFGYCTFDLGELDATRQVGSSLILHNAPLVALCMIVFLAAAAGLAVLLAKAGPQRRVALLLLAAVAIPLAVGIAGGLAGFYLLREKYFIGSLAVFLLLGMLGVERAARAWKPAWLAAVAYAMVVGVSLCHYTVRPELYSRRTFRSELNAYLAAEAGEGDLVACYLIKRVAPWYFTVFDEFDKVVDLREVLGRDSEPEQIGDYARRLSDETPGTIFLVSRELDRNATDKHNALRRTLSELRPMTARSYGRNLQLYVFAPPPPATVDAAPAAGEDARP